MAARTVEGVLARRYWLTQKGRDALGPRDEPPPLGAQAAMLDAVSTTVGGPRKEGR